MHRVEPEVFLVGETNLVGAGQAMDTYLEHIGVPDWDTESEFDSEYLTEAMGRLCYRSWKPQLNPNVTKVREGNDIYLKNILDVKHGSVLEHATLNFIFHNVSRVFTHELVRHRVGVAISQESLRFVRLTNLGFWMPSVFKNHPRSEEIMRFVIEKVEFMERWQIELAEMLDIANEKDFEVKKKFTSAMRRIAPIGLATTIGWSVNVRTLRHVIEMRTHPGAEEEIRLVFGKVAEKVKTRYPHLFSDYELKIVDGLPYYETKNLKV